MSEEHTPGPWTLHDCEVHGFGRLIATVHWCSGLEAEDRANIALIAAAPLLLEMARNARSLCLALIVDADQRGKPLPAGHVVRRDLERFEAAIAKASQVKP